MSHLLLQGHETILASITDRLSRLAQVCGLHRITLRLLPLAVVLAMEEVVRADRHLLIVLLFLRGRATSCRCTGLLLICNLIVDVASCRLVLVRSDFINVLICLIGSVCITVVLIMTSR